LGACDCEIIKHGGDFVHVVIDHTIDIGNSLSSSDIDVDVDGLVYKRFSDSASRS
jgi:hypothetical protein